jgi:hypothetical protein
LTAPAHGRRITSAGFQAEKYKMNNAMVKSKEVTLLEILDRVLDKGVVISGDIVISVADVDLIYLGLKVLLSSVETIERLRGSPFVGPMQEAR